MKNTNHSRILILALSLVILVGAMVGFSSSAEDTEYTNEIVSMNIAYGDTVQVHIALDAPIDNQDGITVKYIDPNGDEQTATYWKTMDVKGTNRPVWYTKGISAKDLGQDVVATVYVDGEAISTANVSVGHYLYTKLYKEGFINATEETDLHKKELYQNLLTYAASAETVLWNDKAENASNQRVLITDKLYVYAVDGTVDADKKLTEDVLTKSETVTLNYTGTAPEGYEFTGIWLSSIDGTSVIKDGVATMPTVHGVYEPIFDSVTHTVGKYYSSETEGTRYDFDTKLNLSGDDQTDLSVYNAETNPTGILANELGADATASLVSDKLSTLDNSTGELVFNMTSTDWTGFNLANKSDTEGATGSKYIAEFDFTYIDSAAYTGSGSSNQVAFYIGPTSYNENDKYMHSITHAKFEADREVMMFGNVPVVKGRTYTIRIETTVDGSYALYVNDVLAADKPGYYTNEAEIPADYDETIYAGFGFTVRQRHAGDSFSFSVDNFYMGTIDSYYDDKTVAGDRYDFTDSFDVSVYDAESNSTGLLAGTLTNDDVDALQTKKTLSLTNTDSRLLVDMTTREWAGFTIANREAVTAYEGSVHIAEFDFTYISNTAYTGTSKPDYNAFAFGISSSGGALNSMICYNYVDHKDDTFGGSLAYNTAVFEMNKTYRIRIESTVGGDELIYVDNVLVSKNASAKGKSNDPYIYAGLGFYFRDRHAGDALSFSIDNLFMTTLDPK